MDHMLGVYLASPTGGCLSFRLELYVNLFDSCSVACSLVHTNLSMIFRQVSSYPHTMINTFISAGLLYIHLRPKVMSGLGWDPPFRVYTPVIGFFFASNLFLVVVPWIPPAPGYQVYEHIPYYVSKLPSSSSRFRVCVPRELAADHIAPYSSTASWRCRLDFWGLCIGT